MFCEEAEDEYSIKIVFVIAKSKSNHIQQAAN